MVVNRIRVTEEDMRIVQELKAQGLTRREIAEKLGVFFSHIRYLLILSKPRERRIWYNPERKNRSWSWVYPNFLPQWWCEKHNFDYETWIKTR